MIIQTVLDIISQEKIHILVLFLNLVMVLSRESFQSIVLQDDQDLKKENQGAKTHIKATIVMIVHLLVRDLKVGLNQDLLGDNTGVKGLLLLLHEIDTIVSFTPTEICLALLLGHNLEVSPMSVDVYAAEKEITEVLFAERTRSTVVSFASSVICVIGVINVNNPRMAISRLKT